MIYIDNSATTKQYSQVTKLMCKYMDEDFGNPSSLHQLGLDGEKAVKNARKQILNAMGLDKGELFFVSGGTEADNMALFGVAKAMRRRGNKIVTTKVEHPAVIECCKALESEGFEVTYIGVDRNCCIDTAALKDAIDEKTVLVSVMHVNNEIGAVMPVSEIKEIMRENGCEGLLHCDAVQSFGKLPMPQNADLISLSGHKIHGPKGSGALYAGRDVKIPELIKGGGQEGGKRSGTENVPAIAGFGLAAEISAQMREENMRRISDMREYLMRGLSTCIDDVVINSPKEGGFQPGMCSPALLNVTFLGTRGEVLLHTLEQDEIYVSTGSACSSNKKGKNHVLTAMGMSEKEIEGTLRFSFGNFNSLDEMDVVISKVSDAVKKFRKLGSFR